MIIRKLLIGLVVVALLGLAGWLGWRWHTTPAPPKIPLERAEKGVVRAVNAALQEVHRQPRDGEAWGKLAMVLASNGYEPQALTCYQHAERFAPENPCWPYLSGVQLIDKGNPREGIPRLRRALPRARTEEERTAILFRLGLALVNEGHLDEAEQHLVSLREIEKDSPRVHFGFGVLYFARDDHPAARKHLSALKGVPFARKQVYGLLASLRDGDEETIRSYQKRAVNLPPDPPWPDPFEDRWRRCKVDRLSRIAEFVEMRREGRLREAVDFLRKFVAESPDAEVCHILGQTLCEVHEFEEAAVTLRLAVAFDPKNVPANYYLGEALLHQGEKHNDEPGGKDRAAALFREAVAAEDQTLLLQSNHAFAHLTRGKALKYLGRTDEALRAMREALVCRPESADIHLALGDTLAEAGQLREALEHLENAVRLASPKDPRPRKILEKWRSKEKSGGRDQGSGVRGQESASSY